MTNVDPTENNQPYVGRHRTSRPEGNVKELRARCGLEKWIEGRGPWHSKAEKPRGNVIELGERRASGGAA